MSDVTAEYQVQSVGTLFHLPTRSAGVLPGDHLVAVTLWDEQIDGGPGREREAFVVWRTEADVRDPQ